MFTPGRTEMDRFKLRGVEGGPGVIQVFLVLSFTSRCGLGQWTFVIVTRIGGVRGLETEDRYCHQGINKG